MGLFNKKPPCAICGGKVGWFLPTTIEGEYICSECDSKMDMDADIRKNLTMQKFREYLEFYEQNKLLKETFVISREVDFGWMDTKMIFDFDHKLFCMSKQPDRTVFEGSQIVSFTIKEDDQLLFEGSADGIKRYRSTVPERARALSTQIAQYISARQIAEFTNRMADEKDGNRRSTPTMDIPEPFKAFQIEIHFNHPYWNIIHCDKSGPVFSNTDPSVMDYMDSYHRDIEMIENLVNGLKTVAFPEVPEMKIDMETGMPVYSAGTPKAPVDAIEEIRKYKALMEEGVITEEEFQAKKRQLLGI